MPAQIPKLTLFGRSLVLISLELIANAVCWIVAGILFSRREDTQLLSLALLAWTLGLRHGLDADHIRLVLNLNVAIAISTDVYNKLNGVGRVGGIVGAAVSGSFLFVVGLANSIILWKIMAKRRLGPDLGNGAREIEDPKHSHMFMMRILGPIITFVDRPWKMYPVGVLFGFGFDTASSIALLAISALAKKGADGKSIPSGYIVLLPLLFTAGMTMVDSCDSVLMLYSYSGFPERCWAVFERRISVTDVEIVEAARPEQRDDPIPQADNLPQKSIADPYVDHQDSVEEDGKTARDERVKMNVLSDLSIVLTLISILVAFAISLITIMGLIGDNCARCQEATKQNEGLEGKWWRAWAKANDNSGYIGAAIVGSFVIVVVGYYASRRLRGAIGIRKKITPG